jgi:hypothetical protein
MNVERVECEEQTDIPKANVFERKTSLPLFHQIIELVALDNRSSLREKLH